MKRGLRKVKPWPEVTKLEEAGSGFKPSSARGQGLAALAVCPLPPEAAGELTQSWAQRPTAAKPGVRSDGLPAPHLPGTPLPRSPSSGARLAPSGGPTAQAGPGGVPRARVSPSGAEAEGNRLLAPSPPCQELWLLRSSGCYAALFIQREPGREQEQASSRARGSPSSCPEGGPRPRAGSGAGARAARHRATLSLPPWPHQQQRLWTDHGTWIPPVTGVCPLDGAVRGDVPTAVCRGRGGEGVRDMKSLEGHQGAALGHGQRAVRGKAPPGNGGSLPLLGPSSSAPSSLAPGAAVGACEPRKEGVPGRCPPQLCPLSALFGGKLHTAQAPPAKAPARAKG